MNFSISPGSGLRRQNVATRVKARPMVPAASRLGGDNGQRPPFGQRDSKQSGSRFDVTPVASIDDAIKAMTQIRHALGRDVGRALDSITRFRPQAREALEGMLADQAAAVSSPAARADQPPTATLTRATITLAESAPESDEAPAPTVQRDVPILLVPRQPRQFASPPAGEAVRPFAPLQVSPSDRVAFEELASTGSLVLAQNDRGFSVELTVTPLAASQPREEGDIAVFTPVGSFQGRSAVNEQGQQVLTVDEAEVTAPIPVAPGAFVGLELQDASFNQMTDESHGTVSVIAGIDVANTVSVSAEQELFTFQSGPRGSTHVASSVPGSSPSSPAPSAVPGSNQSPPPQLTVTDARQLPQPGAPDSAGSLADTLNLPTVSLTDADTPDDAVLVIEDHGDVTTVQGPLIAAIASGLLAGGLVFQRIDEVSSRAGQAGQDAVDAADRPAESAMSSVEQAAGDVRETAADTAEMTSDAVADASGFARDTTSAAGDAAERGATAAVDRGGQALGSVAEAADQAIDDLADDPVSTVINVTKSVVCFGIFCG
ncbi:hypothetical protein CMK11_02665 [Candidatus Poribacteria bacterium]|nr:hypothetical protein [Candidatus Poribacteria bacterium]